MTQTYFVQTETLRIYFKTPMMNFANLIKFPNGLTEKTKYAIFHQPKIKDKLPLKLPIFSINNYEIERSSSIKFIEKKWSMSILIRRVLSIPQEIKKNSQYGSNDIRFLLVSSQLSDLRKYCLVQHSRLKIGKPFQQIKASDKSYFCYNS